MREISKYSSMKHIILILLVTFPLCIRAQDADRPSLDKQEQAILRLGKKIVSHDFGPADKLSHWNAQLINAIKSYASQCPNFMEQSLRSWAEVRIVVHTSSDRRLRIICWNDQMSGTMEEWQNLVFWKAGERLQQTAFPLGKPEKQFMAGASQYRGIWTVNCHNGTMLYVVYGKDHISNRRKYNFVEAYAINNGTLHKTKLFKTPSKIYDKIGLEMDMATMNSNNRHPFIYYEDKTRKLYIPLTHKGGMVQDGSYLVYRFNGTYFVYQGVEKQ